MKMSRKEAQALGLDLNGEGRSARMKIVGNPQGKQHRQTARMKALARQQEEAVLRTLCKAYGLPVSIPEYPFAKHLGRKWRFDYLFEGWLAVEKVGGVWVKGHHSGGQDQLDDQEKFNHAVLLGYSVLQFSPQQFDSGEAWAFVKRVLESEEG